VSLAVIGMIGAAGVWLAGPGEVPVSVRQALAPYIARPGITFGSLALAFVVITWWAPISAARSPLWLLVFGGLAFAGMALLRRQTMEEHPAVATPDVAKRVRGWVGSLGSLRRSVTDRSPTSLEADWVNRLERLQALRERGALSEEEFQVEKTALMQSK
jgi:Short C-terminal domain